MSRSTPFAALTARFSRLAPRAGALLTLAGGLILAPTLALTPAAQAITGPAWTMVRAEDAWVREAPPSAAAMAGYMTLVNPSGETLTLVGASSPQFGEVQMHVIVTDDDGLTKMQQVMKLEIAPKGKLAFAPGSTHLMLMQPKQPLKAGAPVEIVLQWAPKGKTTVRTSVRGRDAKPAAPAAPGHEGHH